MKNESYRVLLIEDDVNDARLFVRSLSKAHTTFDVSHAADFEEALTTITRGGFDVVLLDLALPDSEGLGGIRQLRLHAPELPIVVLTGLADDETALACLDAGAQDYLVKDRVTPDVLERSVHYAMQRQKSATMRSLVDKLQASERSLEKKNRRLARLYKSTNQVIDTVSHDFRTPLTVIHEYASLLHEGVAGTLNEEQERLLEIITDRADDLNDMVDDLLDASRLEAGMISVWRRNCSVEEIVAHVRPRLVRKAAVKQVELQFGIADDLPNVYCDDDKIGHVIVNLANHLVGFCGQPGRLDVWAKFDEGKRDVVIGVTGDGTGINADSLNTIFQRARHPDPGFAASSEDLENPGLGLKIANELVQLNLGNLEVIDGEGEGITISFRLPVAEPQELITRYVDWISTLQNGPSAMSLINVTVPASLADAGLPDAGLADDVDAFLTSLTRRHDLSLRINQEHWIVVLACEEAELEGFFRRIDELYETVNRKRPGLPLPPVTKVALGTWIVPDDVAAVLDVVERAVDLQTVGSP